jgi:hypothetical protein
METVPLKICKDCGKPKPYSAFYVMLQYRDGRQPYCKECILTRQREWRTDNPKLAHLQNKRNRLKRNYDLSIEAYTAMLQVQFYCCAGCGEKFDVSISNKSPCIDHDHKTNMVRELLCRRCNHVLRADVTAELLNKLAAYLRKHDK